ncbi:MAG: sensor histidine kinase [Chloroflexota bacterium]
MVRRLRSSLRSKLLVGQSLVILVGVVTLFAATGLVAPTLFNQLMAEAMGPQMRAMGHVMSEEAAAAMMDLTSRAFQQTVAISLVVAASAAAATAVVVSVFVSGRIAGPILQMARASRRIAAGHYAERVPSGDPDEVGLLAASFNEMASALEAGERRRLELIGDVAHELRTPIANLQGYLEGLLDGVAEPSERTWDFLLGETARLRRLAEDLQELSRAEARQLSVKPRAVAPGQLVDLVVARLGPEFAEKGLALDTVVAPRLPRVLADEDRVVQVLTNLLANALRYTPEGGRVVIAVDQEASGVVFRVKDTGIGVAQEQLPHLFERFYRVDKSRSRAAGGSGVGLTIARALVEAMGGRIWAESPGPDQGTTFSFTLPVSRD